MSDDYKIHSDRNRLSYEISEKDGTISKDSGDGRITLTVKSLQDSTARFEVLSRPDIDAHPPKDHPQGEDWKWATIEGDEEHKFEQDGAHDVIVQVHAHAGMPTSSREVWLRVSDVDHPREIWAEGPDPHVDIQIKAANGGPPWWIWLIVGIVVAGIAVGIILWQVLQKAELGEECKDSDDCAENLGCGDVEGQMRCLGTNAFDGCLVHGDCLSGACDPSNKHCVDKPALDAACLGDVCGAGLECDNAKNICKRAAGQQCEEHEECVSGHCAQAGAAGAHKKKCAAPPKLGMPCANAAPCDGEKVLCFEGFCRGEVSYVGCNSEAQCMTRYCAKSDDSVGWCTFAQAGADDCGIDGKCPPDMVCDSGVCKKRENESCSDSLECRSMYCSPFNNKCDNVKLGQTCKDGYGCGYRADLTCATDQSGGNGKCLYQLGVECKSDGECAVGVCVGSPKKKCDLEEPSDLGGSCSDNGDCKPGQRLVCAPVSTGANLTGVCLYEEGKTGCTGNRQCATQWCATTATSATKECRQNNGRCKTNDDCFPGFRCSYPNPMVQGLGTCRLRPGKVCRKKSAVPFLAIRRPTGDFSPKWVEAIEEFKRRAQFSTISLCQPDTHWCNQEGKCALRPQSAFTCTEPVSKERRAVPIKPRSCSQARKTCVSGSCKSMADWEALYWKEFLTLHPYSGGLKFIYDQPPVIRRDGGATVRELPKSVLDAFKDRMHTIKRRPIP